MDKELLHTKAVREIISLIGSGQFHEGSKLLAERKLCEQFKISRGTLRKALADLEKMGAVAIKPQSGVYVQRFSQSKLPKKVLPKNFKGVSLRDIIIARQAIEVAAIELACDQMDTADLQTIEKLIGSMEKQMSDLPAYLAVDMVFHEFIVKAGGNQVLVTAFEAISEYHKYSQVFSSTHETCEKDSLDFHKKIARALQKRNKKQAVRYLSEHFNNMLESVS
jgi:GntR family transcriptional repressor for pyruvate dehydrogenase complex